MSRPFRKGPVSGVPPAADVSHPDRSGPFDVPDRKRYSAGGLLGRGGMGEVRSALDSRLGRVVARKTARGDDPAVARALVDEARLASRLAHPSILAVLDAGRAADGSLYYTMPVVHGRTLARTIGDAPDLEARLRLVRHFLDLTDAVAYAHSQGVLHRDLKPSNVLVGEYGETTLVDWGLAATLDDAALPGSPAGTPGYASPEQEVGLPLDERSDVYSLGATLYAIIAGLPPDETTPRPLADLAPDCPNELLAIVAKAMAGDPDARYPDARALARDVSAWFEGRRVGAYRYTPWELVVRAVRANRAAFLLLIASAVTVAAVAGLSYRRTVAERDRARLAETEAVSARAASDAELHRALIAQGLVAASGGRRAHAEVLASQALAIAEAPAARGVLARFGGRPRPERLQSIPVEACLRREVSWDGRRVACVGPDDVRIYEPDRSAEPVLRHPIVASNVAFAGDRLLVTSRDAPGVLVLDDRSPRWVAPDAREDPLLEGSPDPSWALAIDNGALHLIDLERGEATMIEGPCRAPDHPQGHRLLAGGREYLLACSDGTLQRVDFVADVATVVGHLPEGFRAVTQIATFADDETRLLVSTAANEVLLYDLDSALLERRFPATESNAAAFAGSGDLVAIASFAGDVTVWRIGTQPPLATLPSGTAALYVSDDVVRVAGASITDWRIPTAARPTRIPGSSGIASLAVSSDGATLASARGSGDLRVHDTESGELLRTFHFHDSVVKDVAFSPDGRLLGAVHAGEQAAHVLSVGDWEHRRLEMRWNFRRVLFPEDGLLGVVPYGPGLLLTFPYAPGALPEGDFEGRYLGESSALDVEGISGEGAYAAYLRDGDVLAIDGDQRTRLGRVESTSVCQGGGWTGVTYRGGFTLYGDGAPRTGSFEVGAIPLESAMSHDGRYLAVGFVDGAIEVWSPAGPTKLAELRGHTAQLSALAFSPDGRWLYSGSWDADVRVWSLAELEVDAATVAEGLQEAWGMTVEAALAP